MNAPSREAWRQRRAEEGKSPGDVRMDATETIGDYIKRLENMVTTLQRQNEVYKQALEKANRPVSAFDLLANNRQFRLTAMQLRIMTRLADCYPRIVTHIDLLIAMEGDIVGNTESTVNHLKVQLSHIRKKIGHDAIVTHWGLGYSLAKDFYDCTIKGAENGS